MTCPLSRAGPYGLSIAAHLAARGIGIESWRSIAILASRHMPRACLSSPMGSRRKLTDPGPTSLWHYCKSATLDTPILYPVRTRFCAYGLASSKRFAPIGTKQGHDARTRPARIIFKLPERRRSFTAQRWCRHRPQHFGMFPRNGIVVDNSCVMSISTAY